MPNIDIKNISDLDINGNDLFEDSESFITEIADNDEQSVVAGGFYFGYYRSWNFENIVRYYKGQWGFNKNRPFRKTNNCGNTVACGVTISD